MHPLGKAPILELTPPASAADPAGTPGPGPIRLAESGYITQYLVDHFGHRSPGLVPPRWKPGQEGRVGGETEAFSRFQYLLHYVEGSFFPVIVQFLLIDSEFYSPVSSILASACTECTIPPPNRKPLRTRFDY